jgi:hypothetical protein|tara:strand:- start:594822 stop:594941 length:120 start_codon:yes stop_codon:yes gene_type:complete
MGNLFYGALTVILTTLLVNNVDQVIPNNVGYYVEMMLPF